MTTTTVIDFSAQFGGRDAAGVVLPHFRSLKAAAKGRPLAGFPLGKLAFVLRVDGEVNSYGLSGAGCVEFDKSGEYLSVDIGIAREDLTRLGSAALPAFISGSLLASVELLKATRDARLAGADFGALQARLREVCVAYEAAMTPSD